MDHGCALFIARLPLIMDSIANFYDNGTMDFGSNVKMQRQDVNWQIVAIAANGITMVLFSTQKWGSVWAMRLRGIRRM